MKLTATKLRENIYGILDQILATGEPVEIKRNGKTLRIAPLQQESRLDRLVPQPGYMLCDPEELVELDWTHEWSELTPSALIPTSSSGWSPVKRNISAKTRKR